MAIDLPEIGQVDWGGDLNAALTQLDEQTVIGAERQGDDIVFLKNNGAEMNLGSFKGDPGAPGAPGPQGPQGPPGTLFQTFLVESYAQPGDTSDSEAWQRAVNDAVALPEGTPSQIIGTRPEYRFHTPVNVRGLKNCRIGGGAGARPVLKAADGAGALIIFRTSAGMGSPSGGGTNIFALGDSMTEDDAWLSQVESYSGITVVDGGLAGQSTTDGALRSGGLPTTVTLESNTLPTSGTATISSINPSSYWRLVSLQRQVRVSLKAPTGDIPGVLFWPTTTQSNWRFEADTAPSTAVSVPAGTSVEVLEDLPNKSAVGYQDHNLIYWMGRNNMSNTSVIERDDAAVMGAFTGKKMILGVLNATNEPRGSSNYNAIVEINRRRAELYGSQFWDVRSYIIHELIYAMNTVPTAADLANMANDCPPPSIMADTVHFSPAASAVLGREMYRQLMYRGMVPYKTGDITENVVFENLRFEGGAADVPDGMFDRNQARTTGPDHITHAIKLDGHRTPGESAMGIVRNITVRDVELRGVRSLPLFIRGASNVVVTQNFIRRCLDTGFIWCQGVKFTLNRVEWSADNGVSLSQGCREVVCADNTIIGSYYAGVHCGGWNGWPGVHHLTVSGNTIVQSRQFGISLIDGATFASVSGNVIDGVLRGGASGNRDYMADVAGQFNGTGILVTGYISSGRGTSTPTVTAVSKDVVISGNSVRNCDRNGINFGAGVSGLSITGNTLRNIGSLTSVSGNPISSTHKAYNIAIGSYGTYSTGMEDVVVTGNQVIDDRAEPATNYAVSLTNVTRGNERSNAGFGMRNPQTF